MSLLGGGSVWGRPPGKQTLPSRQTPQLSVGRPPLWTEWQTLVKTLPSFAVGKNYDLSDYHFHKKNLLRNKVVRLDCGRLAVLVCCIETTRRELGDTRNIKRAEWPLKCRRVTSVRGVQGSQGEVIAVPSTPGIQSDITAVPSTPGIQSGITAVPSTPGIQVLSL